MYNIGLDNIEIILSYYDIFEGEMPDLVEEIKSLNMHKAISIICELIAAKDYKIKVNTVFSLEMDVPYEMALKKMLCEIQATSPEDLNANPLLRKDKHIISLQMLLILLKKLFIYGDYSTLYMDDYEINLDDYKKIVKLQLIIAEKMNDEFEIDKVDMSHFLYGTYHVNYDRNVANEFIRTYYMFEKIGKDKYNFEEDIQGEYKDYYGDFTAKYGYTPTQYIFILFWELSVYFQYEKRLTFHSIWREVGEIYGSTGLKAIAAKVISDLSSDAIGYQEWAEESEKRQWDFQKFIEFPFIMDKKGRYISISEYTLKNTLFEKLFWKVRECYSISDKNAMAFYGRLYERYIQDLTNNAIYPDSMYQYIPEFKFGKQEKRSSDAYIRCRKNLLIVEAKGYSILINSLVKNEDINKNNEKLYVNPILQADQRFCEIEQQMDIFDGIETVYIVSVTMDSVSAVPKYLKEIYEKILDKRQSKKLKYFLNLNIEEYEMLMYLVESQKDAFSVLKEYFERRNIIPFVTYLNHKAGVRILRTSFMTSLYNEAITGLMNMYDFKDKNT